MKTELLKQGDVFYRIDVTEWKVETDETELNDAVCICTKSTYIQISDVGDIKQFTHEEVSDYYKKYIQPLSTVFPHKY
jgi:hypothetical protein